MATAELNGSAIHLVFEDDAQQELLGAAMLRYQNAHPDVFMESIAFAGIVLEWMKAEDRIDRLQHALTNLMGAYERSNHGGLAVAEATTDAREILVAEARP
jgi:hypothetical protein